VVLAQDLTACELPVVGDAVLVGNGFVGELTLRPTDVADLRDREDPDREQLGHAVRVQPERVARGEPSLLGRRGGEAREADHVAGGVDVRKCGSVVVVDRNPPALVRFEPCPVEPEVVGRAPPSRGVEDDVRRNLLPAREACQRPERCLLHRSDSLAEPEDDVQVPQVIAERLDDVVVTEVEELAAGVDDGHARPEGGEHRGELDSDHAGPDDDEGARDLFEPEDDVVGVEDRSAVELDVGRMIGLGADGDHDPFRRDPAFPSFAIRDRERVLVDEPGSSVEQRHVVPEQLVADDAALALDHLPRAH
jgi:hypothetical protein